jgi:hypothetical protein
MTCCSTPAESSVLAVKFTCLTFFRVTACFSLSYQDIQTIADNNIQTKNQD